MHIYGLNSWLKRSVYNYYCYNIFDTVNVSNDILSDFSRIQTTSNVYFNLSSDHRTNHGTVENLSFFLNGGNTFHFNIPSIRNNFE